MFPFSAVDPNNKREYDSLDEVFKSLSGDGTRTNKMVYYVRKELNIVSADIRQTIHDVILVRDIAQNYFKYHPIMNPKYHHESNVHIIG